LGAASVEQLYESIQSLQVSWDIKHNMRFHLRFIKKAHIAVIESSECVKFDLLISFCKRYCRTVDFPVNSAAGQLICSYWVLYDCLSLFHTNPFQCILCLCPALLLLWWWFTQDMFQTYLVQELWLWTIYWSVLRMRMLCVCKHECL
jgi:hypothetical protein